jgi:hypothetical protein
MGFEYIYSLDFAPGKVSFDEAQAICEGVNSNLASIESPEENQFIFELTGSDLNIPKWIGARRNRSGSSISPFSWTWLDGTSFDLDDEYVGCNPLVDCLWAPNEPNDLTGNEDCLQMGARSVIAQVPASWNDAVCSASRQFVCKRPVPASDSGAACNGLPPTPTTAPATTTSATTEAVVTTEDATNSAVETTSPAAPTTAGACPTIIPNLGEGATSEACLDTTEGATCAARCATGLTLVGDSTFTCVNGAWVNSCSFQCTALQFFGDKAYFYAGANVAVTHAQAEAECAARNMRLVSIGSKAENDFVFNFNADSSKMRWIGWTRDRSAPGDTPVFTAADGTTSYAALLAMYDGCTPGEDCLWQVNEPNDQTGSENCVQMGLITGLVNGGSWNDADCNQRRSYVCSAITASLFDTTCSGSSPSTTRAPTTMASTGAACPATIPNLPANAVASCGSSEHGAVCTAQCVGGLAAAGSPTYTCQDGSWKGGCQFVCTAWAPFGSSLYYYSRSFGRAQAGFSDAMQSCQALGATLTSVHTKAENEFIFNLNPIIKSTRWLGGRRNSVGDFEWVDGTSFTIPSLFAGCTPGVDCLWALGEPNNLNLQEECIQMGLKGASTPGGWNDALCTFKRDYVCKAPLPSVGDCTATPAPTTTTVTTLASTTSDAPTPTPTTASTSITSSSAGPTAFALLYTSAGGTGSRPSTLFDGSISSLSLQTSKTQTTLTAFITACQNTALASQFAGVHIREATISFLCYRLTDLGTADNTATTSFTFKKL